MELQELERIESLWKEFVENRLILFDLDYIKLDWMLEGYLKEAYQKQFEVINKEAPWKKLEIGGFYWFDFARLYYFKWYPRILKVRNENLDWIAYLDRLHGIDTILHFCETGEDLYSVKDLAKHILEVNNWRKGQSYPMDLKRLVKLLRLDRRWTYRNISHELNLAQEFVAKVEKELSILDLINPKFRDKFLWLSQQ